MTILNSTIDHGYGIQELYDNVTNPLRLGILGRVYHRKCDMVERVGIIVLTELG